MASFISGVTKSLEQFTYTVGDSVCPALPDEEHFNPANDAVEPQQNSRYTKAFEESTGAISKHVEDLLNIRTKALKKSFKKKLKLVQAAHNQEITELKKLIKVLEKSINNSSNDTAQLTGRVNKLSEDTKNVKALIDDNNIANLATNVDKLRKNDITLITSINKIKCKMTALTTRVDDVDDNATALTTRVDDVEENATALTTRVDDVEENATALTTRVNTVEENATALKNIVGRLTPTWNAVKF